MSAMVPGGAPPGDGPDLDDMVVSYWSGNTFVIQTGTGRLVCASDTVIEVER